MLELSFADIMTGAGGSSGAWHDYVAVSGADYPDPFWATSVNTSAATTLDLAFWCGEGSGFDGGCLGLYMSKIA